MVDVAAVLLALALLTFFAAPEVGLRTRRLVAGGPGGAPATAGDHAARPMVLLPSVAARLKPDPSPRTSAPRRSARPAPPPSADDEEARARRRAEKLFDGVCAVLRVPRPAACPLLPAPAGVRDRLRPIWRDAQNVTPRHVTTLGVILTCCCADGSRGVFTRRTLGHGDLIVEEGAFVSLRDRRLIEPVVDDGADATGVYDVGLDTPHRLTTAAVAALPRAFRTAMRHCGRLPGKAAGADAGTGADAGSATGPPTVACRRPRGWR